VIAALGLAGAYFLNAASFLVVIFSLLIVRHRRAPGRRTHHRTTRCWTDFVRASATREDAATCARCC